MWPPDEAGTFLGIDISPASRLRRGVGHVSEFI